jgi:polar amino acid transport system substrate-binding protein
MFQTRHLSRQVFYIPKGESGTTRRKNELKTSVVAGIIIVILAIAAIGGYYYSSMQKPPEKKILIVGTNTPFPPFEYVENGTITGFDIDVIRALAQRAGYDNIEVKDMSFDSLITALQQGQIDAIAAGMTITPERLQQVNFTDPYWEADQSILVRQDAKFNPQGIADLKGKIVGVQTGTTGEILANENNATFKEIKHYDTFLLAVLDLTNGRVNAVIVDSPVAVAFTKQYPVMVSSTVKTGEEWGFAVRKSDTVLLAKLDAALKDFKISSEWDALILKYWPVKQ